MSLVCESAPAVKSSSEVSLDVVTSRSELARLQPLWNPLVEASSHPNPFLSWEWITAWLDVLAADDELQVLVVRRSGGDAVVGIAPFVVQRRPVGGPTLWRELVFMGCTFAGPDHLDCIAAEGWSPAVAEVVADWLRSPSLKQSGDLVRIDGLRPDSELVATLLEGIPPRARAVWEIRAPFVALPSSWEEHEDRLRGKFRRDVDRRGRKLEAEADGPVSFVTIEGETGLRRGLTDLFRLHQAGKKRGGAFDTMRKQQFYRRVALRFAREGWLRLHLLKVGDETIAAALCFSYGGKCWFYQTGFDDEWRGYAPGFLVLRHAIRRAIDEGAREFDMLRGGHQYKYDWGAEPRSILKTRLSCSPVGEVVVPVTRWLREGRERWKQWREAH